MARSGKKAASDNKNKEKQDARSVSAANFLMQEFKQDEAEAYKFLQTFINGMDRKTPLAYHLAQLIENDDVFQYTLAKRFPAERGAYNETLQEYEKKIEPLKEKRADLRRELEELNEEYGVESASSDDDKTDDDDADLDDVDDDVDGDLEDELPEEYIAARDALQKKRKAINTKIRMVKKPKYKPKYTEDKKWEKISGTKDHAVSTRDWKQLKDWLKEEIENAEAYEQTDVYINLMKLCEHFGFSDLETRFVKLIHILEESYMLRNFVDQITSENKKLASFVLAKMLGKDVEAKDIEKMIAHDAPLVTSGIVFNPENEPEFDGDFDMIYYPTIDEYITRQLDKPYGDLDSLIESLIGEPTKPSCTWEDFDYMAEERDLHLRLLKGAMESDQEEDRIGMNLLFHGLPDTGKTEYCKVLAAKAGLTLYSIGEKDDMGEEPDRDFRLTQLLLAQGILARRKDAACLFDEAIDAIPGASEQGGLAALFGGGAQDNDGASKIFVNRLFEKNKTVTFWTENNAEAFHSSVTRRMTTSMKFGIPPAHVRSNIWRTVAERVFKFDMASKDIKNIDDFMEKKGIDLDKMGRKYAAPVGAIVTTLRNIRRTGGDVKDVEVLMERYAEAVYGARSALNTKSTLRDTEYDLGLLNADIGMGGDDSGYSIEDLTDDLVDSDYKDFSLLFYGPPGTGKTEYAHYIAGRLNMEVMELDASELSGPYVGETEAKIRAAFDEAKAQNKFLVINEADGFLRDRRGATKSWEVSAVNQMLTCLEKHPLPCAFSTNLINDLDQASMRRFSHKMKCDYLRPDQIKKAWPLFFGEDREFPEGLAGIKNLTTGDFANVRRQLKFRRSEATSVEIQSMMAKEARLKNDKNRKKSLSGAFDGPQLRDPEPREQAAAQDNRPSTPRKKPGTLNLG